MRTDILLEHIDSNLVGEQEKLIVNTDIAQNEVGKRFIMRWLKSILIFKGLFTADALYSVQLMLVTFFIG